MSETRLVSGAIIRESACGQFAIGTIWDSVPEVWDNQDAHSCIHSIFTFGDLAPHETKSVKGRIVFVEGDASKALDALYC